MEFTIKTGGGAPAAGDIGMGATGGGGAPARKEVKSKFHQLHSDLLGAIAGFVPGKSALISKRLTAVEANEKLYMLKKVKALSVFSYLQGELPPGINAKHLDLDFIRLINRLFERVCTDIGSLASIRYNREITIQDVDGILKGTNTGQIIQAGKDLALQQFVEVLREVGHDLGIPADANAEQIRAFFADEANQGVLERVTQLDLSNRNLRYLPDEVGRFTNLEHLDLSNNPLNSVPDSIRNWFLAAVTEHGWALEYAPDALKADREVVLAAVTENGLVLRHASDKLKDDRDIVLAAVTQDGYAFGGSASDRLKGDRDFVLDAVRQYGGALEYASEGLRNNRDFVLDAVTQNGQALEYASDELKDDRNFVLAAVKENGQALEYAFAKFRLDRNFVLAAVKENGQALEYAFAKFRLDRNFVLDAVKENGQALEYAFAKFRGDRGVVLAAVRRDSYALRYASDELQNDSDILTAAGLF